MPKVESQAPIIENTNIDMLVERFHAAGKKTVFELLETAAVIAQAHEELGHRHLLDFYNRIGLDPEGSTSRKMRKVGEQRIRFTPYIDFLPDNWTTLYQLAKLTEHKFQKLIDDQVLRRSITAKEISEHTGAVFPPSEPPVRLVIDINKVKKRKTEFASKLKALLEEYDVLSSKTQGATLDKFIAPSVEGEGNA